MCKQLRKMHSLMRGMTSVGLGPVEKKLQGGRTQSASVRLKTQHLFPRDVRGPCSFRDLKGKFNSYQPEMFSHL